VADILRPREPLYPELARAHDCLTSALPSPYPDTKVARIGRPDRGLDRRVGVSLTMRLYMWIGLSAGLASLAPDAAGGS
jgi:hypothetical protein